MKELLNMQKQLVPDLAEVLKKRYTILRHILLAGIAGRRTLASSLDMTERVLRAEVDFLKSQGLLTVGAGGVQISPAGEELLAAMEQVAAELFGLSDIEEQLRTRFGLKQVIVVPGDSDTSPLAKKDLGRAGGAALRKYIAKEDIIAVTGGSTMADIAEWLSLPAQMKGICFVPARGGLGESVELQANTIASTMAKKSGGQYRLLHVPDHLSEEAYQSLIHEPNVQEIISLIRQARIVIHGIGDAEHMAKRRQVDAQTIASLKQDGALAEAFGYYFDKEGRVVQKMPTVGLRLEDIGMTEIVIAVAGGKSKAEAIAAVLKHGHEDVLVTDEAAAQDILTALQLS